MVPPTPQESPSERLTTTTRRQLRCHRRRHPAPSSSASLTSAMAAATMVLFVSSRWATTTAITATATVGLRAEHSPPPQTMMLWDDESSDVTAAVDVMGTRKNGADIDGNVERRTGKKNKKNKRNNNNKTAKTDNRTQEQRQKDKATKEDRRKKRKDARRKKREERQKAKAEAEAKDNQDNSNAGEGTSETLFATGGTSPSSPIASTSTKPIIVDTSSNGSGPRAPSFLTSSQGPLEARLRTFGADLANGYDTCADLELDVVEALKHYANGVIVEQSAYDWYADCDPDDPNPYYGYGGYGRPMPMMTMNEPMMMAMDEAPSSRESGGEAKTTTSESSFGTNNQVEGADEADVAKSDGTYVYAAYGGALFVWTADHDANDDADVLSVTHMPYNDTDPCESIIDESGVDGDGSGSGSGRGRGSVVEVGEIVFEKGGGGRGGGLRHRRTSMAWAPDMMPPGGPSSCRRPEPRIVSLLVHGDRLAVIVSEENYDYHYGPTFHGDVVVDAEEDGDGEGEHSYRESIVNDRTKLSVRVYDTSIIPTDGSSLPLLGVRNLLGGYDDARSIGSNAIVVATANVNTWLFAEDLHRSNPLYCGLDTDGYRNMAAQIAEERVDEFARKLMEELGLVDDAEVDGGSGGGSCKNMFRLAAMQSGGDDVSTTKNMAPPSPSAGIDILGQFVQITAFDMSGDGFAPLEAETTSATLDVPTNIPATGISGAFARSGHLGSVYVSHDFLATFHGGSEYDAVTGEWVQSTFVMGFDLLGGGGGGTAMGPVPMCVGHVPGHLINQYAADLATSDDGGRHLRMATTTRTWRSEGMRSSTENKIYVLRLPEEEAGRMLQTDGDGTIGGPEMELVGETDHLGKPNESIYAVRFMGDRAYVVTFETIDPFVIVDLSEPTNPRAVGELEIPGFSSYLHAITIDDTDLIMGIGQSVDPKSGRQEGLKISLFDVTNATNPIETASFVDMGYNSNAQHDFKSFRYLPENQKLILPKSNNHCWSGKKNEEENFDGFQVYDIDIDGIQPSYGITHASGSEMCGGCWSDASMPPRSFVFDSKITTILSHSVIRTDLGSGETEWKLNLDDAIGDGVEKVDQCWGYWW